MFGGKKLKKSLIALVVLLVAAIAIIVGIFVSRVSNSTQPDVTPDILNAPENTMQYANGDYIYSPSEKSIDFDETECVVFYNDILIAYLLSEISDEKATEIAASVDGLVVGHLSGSINMLQIKVESADLQTLENELSILMESADVIYATYDCPMIFSDTFNDENPWSGDSTTIKDKGNETEPKGNDWWAEAIGAYSAWDYVDQHESELHEITVGIIDSGFDADHRDLGGKISFLENYQMNTEDNHGTHVAGIIGAQNNNIGIRGVADKANLIGVDWSPVTNNSDSPEYINLLSTAEYAEIIKNLIENDVKVINCSWGSNQSGWDVFLSKITDNIFNEPSLYEKAWETYRWCRVNTCVSMMLQLFLNDKTDFLIVQSAGNGYDNTGMVGYNASLTADFCALTEEAFQGISQNYSLGVLTRTWMEKVDFTYENFKNHILIVGSVKNKQDKSGNYQMSSGSNYGDVIDICAPGENIFSALVGDRYGILCGTSMAAPMVSGAAALVWSFSPKSSAAEVKRILCNNTKTNAVGVGSDAGTLYPMLNVGTALQAVLSINYKSSADEKPENMYQEILSIFRNRISTGWSDYDDYGYGIIDDQNEFMYSYMWSLYPVDSLSGAGYAFIDLDNNGIQELLISRNGEAGWDSSAGMIYDLYSFRDGEVVHLFSSGERDRFYLCTDFVIANECSGGASLSGYDYYILDGESSSLRLKERVLYDGWTNEDNPWFYGTSGGNWDASRMTPIAEDKAIGVIDSHEYLPYDLILFSATSGSEESILPDDALQPEDNQLQLIGVLNHIVDDWTDGSIEYRIFSDEQFEENIIHITNGEVMFRNNIERGVVEVTGETSANLAPYVQPGALQSRSELKFDPATDTIYVGNDTHPYYRMSDWVSGNTPDVTYTKPNNNTPEEKKYGDNVTWTLSDGVLRASGVGKMENYVSTSYVPWYEERAKVTSVIMEGTITSVGSYAFDGFGKMTSITLPDTIKSIEEFAFWRCDDLPSITIPNGCTVIGNSAFNWCESLEVITLPATISEIQWNAFAHCENLSDVYFAGTLEQWQSTNISRTGNEELLSATVHYNSSDPSN